MPRSYNLGRREAPKADTRFRIIEAAVGVYRERGVAGASNLVVAKAADVAPATVRNHFPDPEDLARAVFAAMLVEVAVPTPAIFEGLEGLRARVECLARELAAFYVRSQPMWGMYEREPELIRVWGGGVQRYYADIEHLMRVALGELGELGDDERSVAVVASVIGPPTFFALESRGLTFDEAVALTLELALPWLEQRRDEFAARA